MKKNSDTLSDGPAVPLACRYDAYRASLLDALRRRMGERYVRSRGLIIQDALDRLLVAEGLLPANAPLYSAIRSGDPVTIGEAMGEEG